MTIEPTLILTAADVERLLDMDACIAAVERAFAFYGAGKADPPAVAGVHVPDGGFHVKAGVLDLTRPYFAAKCNANFPLNMSRHGLPTIQGVLMLFDASDGRLLALMESGALTALRTAAASAVAAKHLARKESAVFTIVGCGVQGAAHLRALSRLFRMERVMVCDRAPEAAVRLARQMTDELSIDVRAVTDMGEATRASDVVVTCTSSREPFLRVEHVRPGAFVAAVGADNPEKGEIDAGLMRQARVVPDVLSQAEVMGDLHHAIEAKVMTREDVAAELSQVVVGVRTGRTRDSDIVVFDSTGMALQDVAAAAVVYERAIAAHAGTEVFFTSRADARSSSPARR